MFRTRLSALLSAFLIASVLLLVGCDDDSLTPPPVEDDLFARYVSLGNSITAGFQSSGIDSTTQQEAYPVLLAEQMGTSFNSPLLAGDGCPPPLINALTGERAGEAPCELRDTPAPVRLNNVAVPGAAVVDLLDNTAPRNNANVLTQLFLGGRTQVEVAAEVDPTFATIWIGNNDVLNAAFAGVATPETVTSVSDFETRYIQVLNTLEDAGAQGGVLFGVSDITLIPHFSAGAAYAAAAQSGQLPNSFQVENQCATTNVLVPFRYGGSLLQAAQVQDGLLVLQSQLDALQESGINPPSYSANEPALLQCASPQPLGDVITPVRAEVRSFGNEIASLIDDLEARLEDDSLSDDERAAIENAIGALTEAQQAVSEANAALTAVLEEGEDLSILTQSEITLLQNRVNAYNTIIEDEAEDRGWVYQPINPTLRELRESGAIPPFPDFTDPSGDFFGTAFSLDGIHPNGETHQIVANTTIEAINAEYGTSLSTLP